MGFSRQEYWSGVPKGILLSFKKELNNTIYSNMDATRNYHTKWSKSEKERQIPYDTAYMWNLKYDTYDIDEPTDETETELHYGHREQMDGC